MKDNLKTLALIFSITLNLVFIGTTAYYKLSARIPAVSCPFLYEQLNPTKEQLRRVEPIRDRFHVSSAEISSTIKTKRLGLLGLLAASDIDWNAVGALKEEIRVLQQTMQNTIIGHILEETGVFTAKQRKNSFDLM